MRVARLRSHLTKLGDQLVSSVTNYLVLAWVAAVADARTLGAVSVAVATYSFALVAGRAVVGELVLLESSWDTSTGRSATGAALATGILLGLPLAVSGLFIGDELGAALLVVGLGMGPLLVQDACRYVAVRAHRPGHAFANDAVWLAVFLAGAVAVSAADVPAMWLLAVWAAAGAVSGLLGLTLTGAFPAAVSPRHWFVRHRKLWPSMLGDHLLTSGSRNLALVAIASTVGLASSGAIRIAQVVFGPITVLILAVPLLLLPSLSSAFAADPVRAARRVNLLAVSVASATLVWATIVRLAPPGPLTSVFGESWPGALALLVPIGIYHAASAGAALLQTGLRALRRPQYGFRTRLVAGPMLVVAPAVVGLAWGPRAAVWTLAAVEAGAVVALALTLRLTTRSLRSR